MLICVDHISADWRRYLKFLSIAEMVLNPCSDRDVSKGSWSSWMLVRSENQRSLWLVLGKWLRHLPGHEEGAMLKKNRLWPCRMWTRCCVPNWISWICGWYMIKKAADVVVILQLFSSISIVQCIFYSLICTINIDGWHFYTIRCSFHIGTNACSDPLERGKKNHRWQGTLCLTARCFLSHLWGLVSPTYSIHSFSWRVLSWFCGFSKLDMLNLLIILALPLWRYITLPLHRRVRSAVCLFLNLQNLQR